MHMLCRSVKTAADKREFTEVVVRRIIEVIKLNTLARCRKMYYDDRNILNLMSRESLKSGCLGQIGLTM